MAARIGQKLLQEKCSLVKSNDKLEEQLLRCKETVMFEATLSDKIDISSSIIE